MWSFVAVLALAAAVQRLGVDSVTLRACAGQGPVALLRVGSLSRSDGLKSGT
jgi:hypothetical protein